ncbi:MULTISPECIES: type II secretion system protein [unclassified Campylobacter]|uniref:type II secretion system protein n=1 Tax=unclassified Campylobacter TaxID=2593542 RepID=UPI00123823DB|nr:MULTISPECIES: prepilin-type N-terminal cleavage/methylation domain-containing protein [unclassified Campylobacter]KAA6225259.1 prepilin-type N-terminal cleavage/methylation domain-containing protein [Campylobacter sp. LR185c]KAA6227675.1 prepilin-type N-terminal cleavage/methylation domain-containing protein [Campylobacter sp. LR286c]KAA8603284.1 hypothetical protein CGP82_08090 [Campylobacter sp. LR185c]
MKAFSLIELVAVIIILGIVFSGFFKFHEQSYIFSSYINYLQKLYDLEKELYQNPQTSLISIQISSFGEVKLNQNKASNSNFSLNSLVANENNLSVYFK